MLRNRVMMRICVHSPRETSFFSLAVRNVNSLEKEREKMLVTADSF